MSVLIAVEGLDGAGKNTLVRGVVDHLRTSGVGVATFTFPRYSRSLPADIAAEALHGAHGDLRDSVYAMALLFALDRAQAADEVRAAARTSEIVICDRYVASNVAYSAARLDQRSDGEVARWIADLEFGRLGLPVPDRQVLLGVPADVAMSRARSRASVDPGRSRDAYERDDALQRRVDAAYRELAASAWMSPWVCVGDDAANTPTPVQLAEILLAG
ncbi:MAG: dTMP kinase [Gordonia sp. (in: high G+C Gram-positive bacteria)]